MGCLLDLAVEDRRIRFTLDGGFAKVLSPVRQVLIVLRKDAVHSASPNPKSIRIGSVAPMANIPTGDFKKGIKVLIDNEPYEMLECNFVKPGKGQALYKTKLRNLLKGTLLDRTYKSGDGLEGADIHRSDGVYSYRDGDGYVFMDNHSFEQHTLSAEICGDCMKFLQEGAEVALLYWNGNLISMTPPQAVVLQVTYTEPAARGDTATNVTKGATVESGVEVQVPAFIKEGDKIKIEIETGKYMERVAS